MEKILQLYTYVDGGIGDTPFPNAEGDPIEIGAFRYDAKRMGGAPIITASVNYPSCLDNEWTDNVYAEFNGEKYFLKQTPTSSYDNQDSMYKHEIELVSERVILDNVYFYDAGGYSEMETEPIVGYPTKSPEWQPFGNIDIDKEYTNFFATLANGSPIGRFDVVFDEAIRIVGGPPLDIKIEAATGDIYVRDNYDYFKQLGLCLVFSYISYESDKPVSNSTKVVFFGDVRDFASRLQASLAKSGVGYDVLVDDSVTSTEEKLISFEDQFFSNVLQEIYNTYEIPYYFVGKTIHIGYSNANDVIPDLSYGVDDALLSIAKNNANYKIVNRATATGSSDNIPFYYPNNSPKGDISIAVNEGSQLGVRILDMELFANKVDTESPITYQEKNAEVTRVVDETGGTVASGAYSLIARFTYKGYSTKYKIYTNVTESGKVQLSLNPLLSFTRYQDDRDTQGIEASGVTTIRLFVNNKQVGKSEVGSSGEIFEFELQKGSHIIEANISFAPNYNSSTNIFEGSVGLEWGIDTNAGWFYKGQEVELKDLGLALSYDATPRTGDTITQHIEDYINTSQKLMPYRYRVTRGEERFYNAENRSYVDDNGNLIEFNNPFVEGKPREHIFTVEDIKPTIKETVNAMGLRMDMFSEFAYDIDDNDETIESEEGSNREFVHSYFFGKLRKLDFNLFDHAIENQPMTISFTSGSCGACNFEIGVTEAFPQKNPVQVNADGTLKRNPDTGNVICGQFEEISEDECQDIQQDTINNEVWIALKKEEATYGILMPKAPVDGIGGHRPKACSVGQNDGDTFVILGINLPESYIINAERKLEAEIIKYLKDNNEEKFNFSIGFSRIYFEENADVLNSLNENSKIRVIYDGNPYDLYVSSFSYTMSEGDTLPEIKVELDETLKVSQNALQNAISEVKGQLGNALNNIDFVGISTPYFIRKDVDDEVHGRVNFTKGIKFGEGGRVEVMDNNSAKLTIEYLEVTKKASFTSLEIKEKTHVGGQIVISPAAMTCGEVEELDEVYRCYFQTKGADGDDEIFNQFAVNDLAICQTYNSWGSRYYWRKVVGIGEDYIDLSKTLCDEGSDVPMAGDKIIQLGNTEDATRQAAQVLSAYGEDAPSFIMYNGINDFSLDDRNITGITWNPETQEPQMYSYGSFFFGDRKLNDNFITFQKKKGDTKKTLAINADVTIGANSSGLTNLSEWEEKQSQINKAQEDANAAQQLANVVNTSVTTLGQQLVDVETELNKSIAEINLKLDGVVESYFEPYTPSRENLPASLWIEDGTEADHVGDTFTNTELTGENAGKSWRWLEQGDGSYNWQQIADSDAAKALALAGQAQTTADGKNTTFLVKPYRAYKKGDMWVVGSDYIPYGYKVGDLLVSSQDSEGYVESHWSKALRYTDDTVANEAKQQLASTTTALNKAIKDAEKASKDYTDEGKEALQKSIDDLNAAKASITEVYTKAEADGLISAAEQRAIDAAQGYAEAARNAAEVTSKAYADGVADDAERAAIADAESKLATAKQALELAIQEVDAAKSKTFVTQPVPPYKAGDLWVQGETGDIYRCKDGVNKTSGSFDASDWELASKYTDDTTANQALKDAAEAQESAEKANAVAEAAKEVTDALNDDNIFSLVEKRGIRNALKEINPSESDHVITRYYELSAVTNAGAGSWSEITDKANEDYGWYVSNMHEHNGCAIAKVTFNVATLCSVTMHIMSRSDTIYDYTLLGELDGEKLSSPSYLTSGIVANTRNIAVGAKVSHTFYAVSEGEHSVYVYFRKNVNTSVGLDNGYFRVDASPYLRGSLGDYLALCEKKGISGGDAEYYANDLFYAMYHTYKVWENNDTDLSSFEGYRDQMMMLFQYYYASIIELQQNITQSDYDYLTHVFGKGNNLNVEGVVMSQMLAVRNTKNEVQAFLNGSDIGKDETHGKLLIAAGVEDITKPEEAKTKIYEDGRIEVDAPTVNGKVIISDDGFTYYDTSGSVEKLRASMGGTCAGASGVFIAHNASEPDFCTDAAILAIGGDSTPAANFHGGVIVSGVLDARNQGIWCQKIESPVNSTIEIVLPEDDSLTSTIRIPYGMIEGFRPKTRVLNNTANTSSPHMLTHLDHSVFVNISSGTCYIALPNNPQDGQEYYIESRGGNMNIKLTGKSGYSMYSGTTLAANTSVTQTGRALLRFKFYSDANLWVISWLNRDNV